MEENNQKLQVLELEVEEMPLEQIIDNTLVKANVTNAVIIALKEKYGGLKLKSIDDKESYLEICAARKEVRKVGIITEKLCKKGREYAVAIQKKWIAKEKEILATLDEVEHPLNTEIKKFDDEVERIEHEEEKLREKRWIDRNHLLLKMGVSYNNGNWDLNHISYESELIEQASEDTWNDTILPKYRKEYEANEAEKVAEENKRKTEMEAAKKQREEFELQQSEFKKQQEEFEKQKQELQKMKDDAEREKRLEQERKDAEERKKRMDMVDNRASQLIALGMNYSHKAYSYKDVAISVEALLVDEKQWTDTLDLLAQNISARKVVEEQEKRIADAEKEQAVITKAIADAELKKQQEEQKRIDDLAIANDKEKYADVIKYLNDRPSPIMKSVYYRSKMKVISDFIYDLTH